MNPQEREEVIEFLTALAPEGEKYKQAAKVSFAGLDDEKLIELKSGLEKIFEWAATLPKPSEEEQAEIDRRREIARENMRAALDRFGAVLDRIRDRRAAAQTGTEPG